MIPPALSRPAPNLDAEFAALRELEGAARLALWPYLTRLWSVWLSWLATHPRRKTERQGLQFGGYVSAFAEAAGLKVGSLYTHLPAARYIYEAALWEARDLHPALVTVAAGMDVDASQTLGRALEAGHTPERLEGALQDAPDLSAALATVRGWLSEGATHSNADRKGAREAAHARLPDLAPDAPAGGKERDALIYSAFSALPDALARASLHAAQTGDGGPLEALGAALTPGYIDFLKGYFPCFITGDYPTVENPNDGHHLRVSEKESRPNDETPEVIVGVSRQAHIPLPFAPGSGAAHSRAYVIGQDAERLATLVRWQASAARAYAAFVRGEQWRNYAEQARQEKLRQDA